MNKIRIAIADDHPLAREGIVSGLKKNRDLDFVFTAQDGEDLVQQFKSNPVDVILLDNRMPKMNGLEALKIIRSLNSKVKIIILTAYDDEEDIVNFLEAKANSYLLKDVSLDNLYHAIRACLEDDYYYSEFVIDVLLKNNLQKSEKMPPEQKRFMFLTLRERKVLGMILDNKSKGEIAAILNIGVRTVERIRSSILEKTDMHSIEELILYSTKYHLSDLLIDK